MTHTSAELRRALVDKIATVNPALAPQWRDAVAAVDRALFIPPALYRPSGTLWEPVSRAAVGEEEWLRMVHSDRTWVTQVEGTDASDATGFLSGSPTSSATLPSLVARTLHVANPRQGARVLEIGTGTGYSTAVLAHWVGAENVVSVEYDPGCAAAAAGNLKNAGYSPTLVVGDGLQGHKERADYDSIVATCSVRSIPPSWLFQLADGGSITVTISGWMLAAGMIRLVLDDNGAVTGRFMGDEVTYMLARPHERPPHPTFYRRDGRTRPTRVDPGLTQQWTGRFVAQLAAPSAELLATGDGLILWDVATGSQAWTEASNSGWRVHQHGPQSLWDQVEDALEAWQQHGAPDMAGFGMTATFEDQLVWLGHPGGPSWRLPA
ncbi:ATP-grasp peptide maturase system methyltransferase [Streptomyces sp. A73]|uniref:ATP-grasp peptide maturase system methyltransferase n=1 Tax=Streptomyces smyrnaeus TaxID=1387713 RepID=UPI001B587BC7|nr:ATP-grasp peptide maturase system methyltransferase [Streptomyces sp. A73]